jgi:hypothetical protein
MEAEEAMQKEAAAARAKEINAAVKDMGAEGAAAWDAAWDAAGKAKVKVRRAAVIMADWKSRATKELRDADANQVKEKTLQLRNAESAAKEAIVAAANAYKDIAEAVDAAVKAVEEAVEVRARAVSEAEMNTKDMQHMYSEAVVKAVSARVKSESAQRIFDKTLLGLSRLGFSYRAAENELQDAMTEMVNANEEQNMAHKRWEEALAAAQKAEAIRARKTRKKTQFANQLEFSNGYERRHSLNRSGKRRPISSIKDQDVKNWLKEIDLLAESVRNTELTDDDDPDMPFDQSEVSEWMREKIKNQRQVHKYDSTDNKSKKYDFLADPLGAGGGRRYKSKKQKRKSKKHKRKTKRYKYK